MFQYATPQELIPVPALKPEFIVALVSGLAASIGLDTAGKIKAGEKVLVTAAAGGLGQVAVQWAKLKGCYVIGTTSSAEKADYLTSIGVDKVINYKTEDLSAALTRDFPEGVDVIWETIGGKTFETLINHLAPHGRMVTIGAISGYLRSGEAKPSAATFNPHLFIMKEIALTGFTFFAHQDKFAEYLPVLIKAIAEGSIKVAVDPGDATQDGPFKGIKDVRRAVAHLFSGKNKGKVVVQLHS